MKKICFDVLCVEEELIGRDLINKAGLTVIKIVNYETYVGGKEFDSEHDSAKALLENGNGIVYNGMVLFQADNLLKNSKYHRYAKFRTEKIKKYNAFLNGALVKELSSLKLFPVIRAVIQLYIEGIISKDKATEDLKKYLPQSSIFSLLDDELIQMVG